MAKYKLIREYPDSPKLGYVCSTGIYMCGTSEYDCKHYPEFWEKVEEKDYEILSFKDNEGKLWNQDTQLNDCWCYINGKAPFYQEKQLIKFDGFKIHSILRKSDGEVFTVGDRVSKKINGEEFDYGTLTHIYSNFEVMACDRIGLSWLVKSKQPLFTTEDGVDVFEGDDFYGVYNMKLAKHDDYTDERRSYIFTCSFSAPDSKVHKWFSTKEAAKKYISENKPKYSLNAIKKALQDAKQCGMNEFTAVLFENLENE